MKKINVYIFALISVIALMVTACTEEVEYKAAGKPDNAQIYFSNTLKSNVELSKDATSFTVELRRIDTKEAVKVNLKSTDESGLFTIPTSVDFEAGSEIGKINIGYDPETLEYDDFKVIALSIDDQTTPYGTAKYEFKAGIPAPWTSLGMATFRDEFWFSDDYQVELQQHMLEPNRYRLVDPYSQGIENEGFAENGEATGNQAPFVEFVILPAGSAVNGVQTTIDGLVFYDGFSTGIKHPKYGVEVEVMHPFNFQGFETEDTWVHNIVTQYTEAGKPGVVQFAPMLYMDGLGGLDYTQEDGVITIVFPGFVMADYTTEIEYGGRFIDAKENAFAIVKVTLGEDIESAKVALVPGEDLEAAVEGIIDGSMESVEISASGNVNLPCNENGTYSAVVVSYAGDKVQKNAAVTFDFYMAGGPYDQLLKGIQIDHYVGEWLVPAEDSKQSGELLAVVTKADDKTLLVNGLSGQEEYDDTMVLNYDKETGWLTLVPQQVESYQGFETKVVPVNIEEGYFDEQESFVGGLTEEGTLLFLNSKENTEKWNAIAYICETKEGPAVLSPFSHLTWTPYSESSPAKRIGGLKKLMPMKKNFTSRLNNGTLKKGSTSQAAQKITKNFRKPATLTSYTLR